jgi:hypothetical protein
MICPLVESVNTFPDNVLLGLKLAPLNQKVTVSALRQVKVLLLITNLEQFLVGFLIA